MLRQKSSSCRVNSGTLEGCLGGQRQGGRQTAIKPNQRPQYYEAHGGPSEAVLARVPVTLSSPPYPERNGCPVLRHSYQGPVADPGTRARVLTPCPGPFPSIAPQSFQGQQSGEVWEAAVGATSATGTTHHGHPPVGAQHGFDHDLPLDLVNKEGQSRAGGWAGAGAPPSAVDPAPLAFVGCLPHVSTLHTLLI